MRNIYKLIDAIRKEAPKEWEFYPWFMEELDNVKSSADYRAPEAYVVNFEQLGSVLGEVLGEPDTDWKKKIADIFADKIKIDEDELCGCDADEFGIEHKRSAH